MSSAPGSQEPGFKPDNAQTGSLASTIKNTFSSDAKPGSTNLLGSNQNTASSGTTSLPQEHQTSPASGGRRRSSVEEGYNSVLKSDAAGAHTHSHADQNASKPGVIGSLFSSYVKGGK